jgi:hypothetical protein
MRTEMTANMRTILFSIEDLLIANLPKLEIKWEKIKSFFNYSAIECGKSPVINVITKENEIWEIEFPDFEKLEQIFSAINKGYDPLLIAKKILRDFPPERSEEEMVIKEHHVVDDFRGYFREFRNYFLMEKRKENGIVTLVYESVDKRTIRIQEEEEENGPTYFVTKKVYDTYTAKISIPFEDMTKYVFAYKSTDGHPFTTAKILAAHKPIKTKSTLE